MSDYVIFKFRAINKRLMVSLINGELYFSQPSCLNDPFDCRVDVLKALDNAILQSSSSSQDTLTKLRGMQGFFEKVQADTAQVGVCSFSLELNNPLMWSHYADEHRGVCLMYRFPETYFYDTQDRILGIDRVEYGTSPLTDWFVGRAPSLGSFDDFGADLVTKILTIKAKPWEYEQEVRILRRTPGTELLAQNHLRQICFGLEASKADVGLITKILKQGQCDLTLCKMVRCSDTDFGLRAEEI